MKGLNVTEKITTITKEFDTFFHKEFLPRITRGEEVNAREVFFSGATAGVTLLMDIVNNNSDEELEKAVNALVEEITDFAENKELYCTSVDNMGKA